MRTTSYRGFYKPCAATSTARTWTSNSSSWEGSSSPGSEDQPEEVEFLEGLVRPAGRGILGQGPARSATFLTSKGPWKVFSKGWGYRKFSFLAMPESRSCTGPKPAGFTWGERTSGSWGIESRRGGAV